MPFHLPIRLYTSEISCVLPCRSTLKEQVDLALQGLDMRPRNILRWRYGLQRNKFDRPLTLNEVRTLCC